MAVETKTLKDNDSGSLIAPRTYSSAVKHGDNTVETILDRSVQVNLASTASASLNGTGTLNPGVTGSLPVANGGTGATTAANARTNLGAQATITGAATTITSSDLTASRALVSNSSGKVAVSDVTSTELGYLDGVTSAIQTQLDGKAASSHGTHVTYGDSAAALGTSSAGSATTVPRSDHVHALPALTSCTGTLTVAKGGTGKTTLTSGAALVGNGTSAVTTRTIRNNTATSGAVTADTALITSNTLRYAINRTTSVAAADTNYTTYMARGIALVSAETAPTVNGTINFVYE